MFGSLDHPQGATLFLAKVTSKTFIWDEVRIVSVQRAKLNNYKHIRLKLLKTKAENFMNVFLNDFSRD